MKRVVIIFLLLAGAAGGWYAWNKHNSPPADTRPEFHGNVDIREVRLGFRVSGRVGIVLKDEGAQVAAGDTLARLDDEPYRHAVAQAEAQVQGLAARLEELKRGNRPQEIEQAKNQFAEAVAAQDIAWTLFKRQRDLLKVKAVSQQEFDNARSVLQRTTAQRDAAKAALDLLVAGTRREQITQAEANLAAATATLANAKTQLADTVLKAPEPGVVLTRAIEPGSLLQAGSTAMTISLLSPVWARAYVPETQLGQIYPGREVLVFTDSRKEPYHGHVGDVSSRSEFTPKSVETSDLRTSLVYRFRVILRDPDQGLRQGMPITVRLAEDMASPRTKITPQSWRPNSDSDHATQSRYSLSSRQTHMAQARIVPVVVRMAE